jgi:hypothetical protein
MQGNMDATFVQFGLKERIPRISGPTYCSSLMSVHHCASILIVRLGACWNCILTQSVNFTVFLITTPRHSILSSSILFCPIIIPCCSRLLVIPSKFSSDSASASPSGSDAILLEQSPYKASSYQSSQRSVCRDACVTVQSVRCLEFRNN